MLTTFSESKSRACESEGGHCRNRPAGGIFGGEGEGCAEAVASIEAGACDVMLNLSPVLVKK
jgi:hypothetical protein